MLRKVWGACTVSVYTESHPFDTISTDKEGCAEITTVDGSNLQLQFDSSTGESAIRISRKTKLSDTQQYLANLFQRRLPDIDDQIAIKIISLLEENHANKECKN